MNAPTTYLSTDGESWFVVDKSSIVCAPTTLANAEAIAARFKLTLAPVYWHGVSGNWIERDTNRVTASVRNTKQVRVTVEKDGRRTIAFNVITRPVELTTYPDGTQLVIASTVATPEIKRFPVGIAHGVKAARQAVQDYARTLANVEGYVTDASVDAVTP